MTKPDPRVTVIVPTWNRHRLLAGCLDSLRAQTAACVVQVVDNGSTDSTSSMMAERYTDIRYLRLDRNEGFARAVNVGIENATTEFVALLNNDAEADTGWIAAGLRVFDAHPECGVIASRMLNYWRRDRIDSAGDCYSRTGLPFKRGNGRPATLFSRLEPVLGASGGAAFYRRTVFEKAGLFDEGYYMYLEDVDMSLRARLAGFDCLYVPDAVVYHMEAASDPARNNETPGSALPMVFYSDTRVFWITRNRWQLMITYQPFRHLPWLVFGWTRSFLFHLLKAGHFRSFAAGLKAGVAATPKAFSKRRRLRREAVIRQDDLWRLMCWQSA